MPAQPVCGLRCDIGIQFDAYDPVAREVAEPVIENAPAAATDVDQHVTGTHAPPEDATERGMVTVLMGFCDAARPQPTPVQQATAATQVGAGPAGLKNGSKSGAGLAADYALSKSTHILASYANWEYAVGAGARSTETSLVLSYAF